MDAAERATNISTPQSMPWAAANHIENFTPARRQVDRYCVTRSAPAGTAGKMYPGSLDCEMLKNRIGTSIQMSKKSGQEFRGSSGSFLGPSGSMVDSLPRDNMRRTYSVTARTSTIVQGIVASKNTGR